MRVHTGVLALGFAGMMIGSWLLGAEPQAGIDRQAFDTTVRAQDDLFLHTNGEWLKHTPIPADKSNYGTFVALTDFAQANLRARIEEAAAEGAVGSEARKVGDFYASYLDAQRLAERGWQPLAAEWARIEQLQTPDELMRHWAVLRQIGVRTPCGFFIDQDDRNSTVYLAAVVQSGTTLPDREYYLQLEDEKYRVAREALVAYIVRLWELVERPNGRAVAESILALETELARVQWARTELRNAEKRYNKFAVSELSTRAGNLPWSLFLAAAGAGEVQHVNVLTPSYFVGLERILRETPLETWRDYLRYHLLDAYAPFLSRDFEEAHFELHEKVLAGVPQQKPRWQRAVEATAGAGAGDFGVLGDAVGKLYVERHFPPEAKAQMDRLVQNLLAAFGDRIDELTWMTPATKQRAREKLTKITTKIGYTTKWRDYHELHIERDDLAGNMQRSARHEYQRMLAKLAQAVDRDEWGMTPQTVNAYYNPGLNEIVFPAAILQPPIFDPTADPAVNYGAIGAVIGHEISHAFDDQGSKFDGDGNLNNWWTDADRAAFQKLTQRLITQFANYEALPGKRLNGELTLGENIADLSGLAIAHQAYRLSLQGQPAPVIDGWTGDQRFFLGWSQLWRRKYRDAELLRRLLTDPHSPSRFRANGPVTNIDAFYEAFNVQPGDQLYRPIEARIRIW
jgi:putative endopeptidase